MVSFGVLPAIATLGQAYPRFPRPGCSAAGALLGVAAHVTNVLPDLADDDRTGIRGLPHRLGARAERPPRVRLLSPSRPSSITVRARLAARGPLLLVGLVIGLGAAVTGVVLLLRRSPPGC